MMRVALITHDVPSNVRRPSFVEVPHHSVRVFLFPNYAHALSGRRLCTSIHRGRCECDAFPKGNGILWQTHGARFRRCTNGPLRHTLCVLSTPATASTLMRHGISRCTWHDVEMRDVWHNIAGSGPKQDPWSQVQAAVLSSLLRRVLFVRQRCVLGAWDAWPVAPG